MGDLPCLEQTPVTEACVEPLHRTVTTDERWSPATKKDAAESRECHAESELASVENVEAHVRQRSHEGHHATADFSEPVLTDSSAVHLPLAGSTVPAMTSESGTCDERTSCQDGGPVHDRCDNVPSPRERESENQLSDLAEPAFCETLVLAPMGDVLTANHEDAGTPTFRSTRLSRKSSIGHSSSQQTLLTGADCVVAEGKEVEGSTCTTGTERSATNPLHPSSTTDDDGGESRSPTIVRRMAVSADAQELRQPRRKTPVAKAKQMPGIPPVDTEVGEPQGSVVGGRAREVTLAVPVMDDRHTADDVAPRSHVSGPVPIDATQDAVSVMGHTSTTEAPREGVEMDLLSSRAGMDVLGSPMRPHEPVVSFEEAVRRPVVYPHIDSATGSLDDRLHGLTQLAILWQAYREKEITRQEWKRIKDTILDNLPVRERVEKPRAKSALEDRLRAKATDKSRRDRVIEADSQR